MLDTCKTKTAIAEIVYYRTMYQDALRRLERKIGESQDVVTTHLDNMDHFLSLKMENNENTIRNSETTISKLNGVFRSLHYIRDLTSATLLGHAVQKMPPKLKESWAMHPVKNEWRRPTLQELNDWLKEKAEAHEDEGYLNETKADELLHAASKTRTASKVLASTSKADAPTQRKKSSLITKFVFRA